MTEEEVASELVTARTVRADLAAGRARLAQFLARRGSDGSRLRARPRDADLPSRPRSDPDSRLEYFATACRSDVELLREVESLLAHDQEAAPDRTTEAQVDAAEVLPSVGPYRVVQKLGEGGMGEIFLAERIEPVRQRIARKLIKHSMDSKKVVARFKAERQALALMYHACVAKVFDAGTQHGRPYFADFPRRCLAEKGV